MNGDIEIREQSSLHRYRTELPNILFDLKLDPSAFQLYCYYKRIAGDNGACFQKKGTIAENLNMSESTIKAKNKILSERFPLLDGKPLIRITQRKDENGNNAPTLIQIIDIWPDNFKEIATGSKFNPPSAKICPTLGQNLAAEEEPIKKNPYKKKESTKEKPEMGETPKPPARAFKQRRENIKTTDEEHHKLMNEIGEELLEACYDRLQEWKEDTPRTKWKRSDYRSIKRWVINAIQEDKQREAKAQKSVQQENNIDFAK